MKYKENYEYGWINFSVDGIYSVEDRNRFSHFCLRVGWYKVYHNISIADHPITTFFLMTKEGDKRFRELYLNGINYIEVS